jgi:hypothetical protein
LQTSAGSILSGYTENVGTGGEFMRSQDLALKSTTAPQIGDLALLTLFYFKGDAKLGLRVRCRIAQSLRWGVGGSILSHELTDEQFRTLEEIVLTNGKLP